MKKSSKSKTSQPKSIHRWTMKSALSQKSPKKLRPRPRSTSTSSPPELNQQKQERQLWRQSLQKPESRSRKKLSNLSLYGILFQRLYQPTPSQSKTTLNSRPTKTGLKPPHA